MELFYNNSPFKIALFGFGRMGKTIKKLACARGQEVVAVFTSIKIDYSLLQTADVCIDFSVGHAVLKHARQACAYKKPLIIGTTGWEDDLSDLKQCIQDAKIGCLYGANFSLGVYLFCQILHTSALMLRHFPQYDAAGLEIHRKDKKDKPSGTALNLMRLFKETSERDLHFTSVRLGSEVGTHRVLLRSSYDTIELTHRASNREGFAEGALQAAAWIKNKQGLFTFEDMLEEKLQCLARE